MIDDEAELLADIRFALRRLDPWPPHGSARPSEDYARRVLKHLRLCGWEVRRPAPKKSIRWVEPRLVATVKHLGRTGQRRIASGCSAGAVGG
jgi:hypothetical protein